MERMGGSFRLFSSMPRGTAALFFIQIFSCLSYSVLYSSLILYMRTVLGFTATEAATVTGVFIAYNYALHLLGGYLAGRYLSNRMLFCMGMAIQVLGCLLLTIPSKDFLFVGLSAFLTGCGLNVTCVNCMLTQLFSAEDTRREKAFMYNYAAMNGGFLLGFSMGGYFHMTNNYPVLFVLSAMGNFIALCCCLASWSALNDKETIFSSLSPTHQKARRFQGFAFVFALFLALNMLLKVSGFANQLVLIAGIAMLGVLFILAKQQPTKELKQKLQAFIVLTLAGLVFWTLYQIAPMGLNLFIDKNVNRHITMFGWDFDMPPQWFQNINALAIIIGGPLLSYIFTRMRQNGKNVHVPGQFAIALLLIGLAFLILPIGIHFSDAHGYVHPQYILWCYLLQSIGELLISPVGYAMIGSLIPNSLQGLMTGIWMMATGVGATLSSYSSHWMTAGATNENPLTTNVGYSHVFTVLGISAIMASIIVYFLIPSLKRYMGINANSAEENISGVSPVET